MITASVPCADDVAELALEVGYARAKFDYLAAGHFNNRYLRGTPEHDGYEAFATKIRARSQRSLHAAKHPFQGEASC
jgi:hypothetical protein